MKAKREPVAPAMPVESMVGWRIRALRRKQGMTLQQLAEIVSLDRGHISRLERGEKSPSIGTLQGIAHGLGVTIGSLLGETDPHEEVHVVRAGKRKRVAASSQEGAHQIEVVASAEAGSPLDMLVITVGTTPSRSVAQHAGDEVVYVLEGRVRMQFGEREMLLGKGDSARFPGYLPHSMMSAGPGLAKVLVAVTGGD